MPEKLARSVVVTPCCRHHSLTERPLLRHSWICVAHSCSSARCFNSALVILTPHNTTVAKPFATFRYYCLMCVYARLGLTVTTFFIMYLHFGSRVQLRVSRNGAENGTGIIRGNSTKNNKQKRQSPKVGNWRHTDSMFYDYRLTSRIMPVEERKGMRCEQGFF